MIEDTLLLNFGFSAVVCGWFMWKVEPALNNLNQTVANNTQAINLLVELHSKNKKN